MKARTVLFFKFFIPFTLLYIPIETCLWLVLEPNKSFSVLLYEHYSEFVSPVRVLVWLLMGVLMWLLFVKTNLIVKK